MGMVSIRSIVIFIFLGRLAHVVPPVLLGLLQLFKLEIQSVPHIRDLLITTVEILVVKRLVFILQLSNLVVPLLLNSIDLNLCDHRAAIFATVVASLRDSVWVTASVLKSHCHGL